MNALENKEKTKEAVEIVWLVIIGAVSAATLTVFGFFIRVNSIVGFPLSPYGGLAWLLGGLVIIATISILFGGLLGLIISLLKITIPKGILTGLIISLFYSTTEMLFHLEINNKQLRNAFLQTAIITGIISYSFVGGLIAIIKNKFAS